MFKGFTDETFEFFMAIRFNNNRDFFHANHDWYVRAVRQPCLELAEDLGGFIHEHFSPEMDTRPNRVVSHINRDLRFSNDKSPYRDYMWLTFRKPSVIRSLELEVYFAIETDGASWGMGIYGENKPLMNGFRRKLRKDPTSFLRCLDNTDGLSQWINAYKRMQVPEEIPAELENWYKARSFYLDTRFTDFQVIKSAALTGEMEASLQKLTPLYRYFQNIIPEDDTINEKE